MSYPDSSPFFLTTGPQSGLPVLLLHGGGAASWMWRKVMERLPEYHCIAPDMPEQGKNRLIAPFSIEFAADMSAELLSNLRPNQKAIVIGLSEGAQVAVAMLKQHPAVIERAFISSALLHPLPATSLVTPAVLSWSYRYFMAPFRNFDFWILLNMRYSAGLPIEYYSDFKQEFQQMTEAGFTNLLNASLRFRLPPNLENTNIPTLITVGKREYSAMRQSARSLASTLPCAQAYTLDLGRNSSLAKEHNWALTAPDLFASVVKAWVSGKPMPKELQPFQP